MENGKDVDIMQHELAVKITEWCGGRNEMKQGQAEVVAYGIELLFDNLFKLAALLILGILFRRTWEVVLCIGCFSLLRSQAGGVHRKSNIGCFAFMLAVCVLSCIGAEYIQELPTALLAVISVGVVLVNKLCAPFCTVNNPIVDENIRRRKNIWSVALSILFLTAVWLAPMWEVKMLILIPVTIETLTILPWWSKE